MTVIKDVELMWAKLDPNKPVSPFGEPVWELQIRTRDKAEGKRWKDEGINVKTDDDDEGIYYFANLKRKAVYGKTGEKAQPVVTVDGQLMPIDAKTIGNHSRGNVQLFTKPYDFNGKKGIKVELKAVQVTKLVEFKAQGGGIAFEAIGDTEIIDAPASSSNKESEDLWD